MNFEGLTDYQVNESRQEHGSNSLTQKEQDSLFHKFVEGFKDPMLIILIVALVINLIFVFMGRSEWFEAVGIFIAICIANLVGVLSENKQESKAMALRAEQLSREKVKVYRNGKLVEIGINDIVVGDIISLQTGDKLPADGIIVKGTIQVDQSTLNGESVEATKTAVLDNELGNTNDLFNPYYVYRGTVVTSSEGLVEVQKVGDKTIYGQLALEMQDETRDTPLKVKLGILAKQISKFGYIGAGVIAIAYLFQNIVLSGNPFPDGLGLFQLLIEAISLAVVIIVMAVPEGLPMMIALVLSMNMAKMMKDNVLVRKLNGIETAGGLNLLFSDKTGTITEGKLSVVQMATGNVRIFTDIEEIHSDLAVEIIRGIGINNSATYTDGIVIGGNSTDRALMNYLRRDNHVSKIDKKDVQEFNPFDSSKKFSSTMLVCDGTCKTYIKGAPEKIIDQCTMYMDENGKVQKLVEKNILIAYMNEQAGRSMRLLAVAIAPMDETNAELTLVSIVSIRDNVRAEAVEAIRDVQSAGVQVVMITGDRKETAVAIAKESGLLKEHKDIALTSDELNAKTDEELKVILPDLRVVARALPTDKSRLVRIAQELDLVVGMTGDGVNDAPALKKSDVGFAMGSGTDVAKEAGEITILDDNFLSIKKAILYGRTIFRNIRKFIIFQLTINIAAVVLSFIAPLLGISQPISIISLLYINLVMDTLAALAFGGEPSLKRFMKEKPISRRENIVNTYMASQILVTSAYIVIVSLAILLIPSIISFYAPKGTEISVAFKESAMLVFFMLTAVLNGFYARTEGFNPLEYIHQNKQFVAVMIAVVILLVVLVQIIGPIAGLVSLPLSVWGFMSILALGSIPLDTLRKLIMKKKRSLI